MAPFMAIGTQSNRKAPSQTYGIEIVVPLGAAAARALADYGCNNVHLMAGNAYLGWADKARSTVQCHYRYGGTGGRAKGIDWPVAAWFCQCQPGFSGGSSFFWLAQSTVTHRPQLAGTMKFMAGPCCETTRRQVDCFHQYGMHRSWHQGCSRKCTGRHLCSHTYLTLQYL